MFNSYLTHSADSGQWRRVKSGPASPVPSWCAALVLRSDSPMHTPALPRTRSGRTAILLTAVLLLTAPALHAETILFKDGFALTGTVVRQKKTLIDPVSNTPVELQEGFFMVDDGARAIIFSP